MTDENPYSEDISPTAKLGINFHKLLVFNCHNIIFYN